MLVLLASSVYAVPSIAYITLLVLPVGVSINASIALFASVAFCRLGLGRIYLDICGTSLVGTFKYTKRHAKCVTKIQISDDTNLHESETK